MQKVTQYKTNTLKFTIGGASCSHTRYPVDMPSKRCKLGIRLLSWQLLVVNGVGKTADGVKENEAPDAFAPPRELRDGQLEVLAQQLDVAAVHVVVVAIAARQADFRAMCRIAGAW